MDGGDFFNALPLIAAVVDTLRPASGLQRSVGVSGPRRPPLFGVLAVVPVGGILPMILPSAFAVRDTVALAVQIVNLAALRSPFSIFPEWSYCQHNMGVGVAIALVVERKIGAHSLCHKIVFDE